MIYLTYTHSPSTHAVFIRAPVGGLAALEPLKFAKVCKKMLSARRLLPSLIRRDLVVFMPSGCETARRVTGLLAEKEEEGRRRRWRARPPKRRRWPVEGLRAISLGGPAGARAGRAPSALPKVTWKDNSRTLSAGYGFALCAPNTSTELSASRERGMLSIKLTRPLLIAECKFLFRIPRSSGFRSPGPNLPLSRAAIRYSLRRSHPAARGISGEH